MKINKALFLHILFLFSGALLRAVDYPGDALISSNIVYRLQQNIEQLSFEQQFNLINRALEFDKSNIDAWNYKAVLLGSKIEHTAEAYHAFNMMLSCDQEVKSDYVYNFAKFLYRTNDVNALTDLYLNHSDTFVLIPEAYFLLKSASIKVDPLLDDYHYNKNFEHSAIMAVKVLSDSYFDLEDESWIYNSNPNNFHMHALLYLLNDVELSDSVFLKLYHIFLSRYPDIEDIYRCADTLYINRFRKLPTHGIKASNQRSYILSVLSTGIQQEQMIHSFYTGLIFEDYNFDGIYEEEYHVAKGLLTHIKHDRNQDGIPDVSISIDGTIKIVEFNENVSIEYFMYPYVRKVVYQDNEYYFKNFSMKAGVLEFDLNLDPKYLIRLPWEFLKPAIDPELFYNKASMIVNGGRTVFLNNGEITQIIEDVNLDGLIDLEIDFVHNKAESGRRDLNFDGFFDLIQLYEEGELVAVKVDQNNSGIPEYINFLTDQLRAWDLNEDGLLDIEEIQLNRNEKIKLASSYLDGIFDYIMYESYE